MTKNGCPIEGVSKRDCPDCSGMGWGYCVYVLAWEARGRPSKSSPYKPLTINKSKEMQKE